MVVYFLGSSVTYGEANNGVSFCEYIANHSDIKVFKEAVSGTTLVDNDETSYISRMKECLPHDEPVNYVIVQLSTNDATQNKPLGQLSDFDEENVFAFDTSTVIGAMEYIIAYVKDTYGCKVVFYTNPKYQSECYLKMIEALYLIKEKWDIDIIDFYNYVGMENVDEKLPLLMADPIHPNADGYEWMGKEFLKYLQK